MIKKMKMPSKTLFGKTWVGWLNVLLFQWFFVRLSYGTKWSWLTGVVPCTGWWSDYRFVTNKERS
jgi:hypothetical protein